MLEHYLKRTILLGKSLKAQRLQNFVEELKDGVKQLWPLLFARTRILGIAPMSVEIRCLQIAARTENVRRMSCSI